MKCVFNHSLILGSSVYSRYRQNLSICFTAFFNHMSLVSAYQRFACFIAPVNFVCMMLQNIFQNSVLFLFVLDFMWNWQNLKAIQP